MTPLDEIGFAVLRKLEDGDLAALRQTEAVNQFCSQQMVADQ